MVVPGFEHQSVQVNTLMPFVLMHSFFNVSMDTVKVHQCITCVYMAAGDVSRSNSGILAKLKRDTGKGEVGHW